MRYQDDFLLFHPSKDYLKYCLSEIEKFLEKEKLTLNRKTRIFKNTNNFLFLARNCNGNYSRYKNVKRKLRSKYYLYKNNKVSLNSFVSSLFVIKVYVKSTLNGKNDILSMSLK